MESRENLNVHRTQMQKDMILERLKERGCRITRQRVKLIEVILENECSSCKEIFFRAREEDHKVGAATVYRMVNLLEEIGAISRKNMYRVEYGQGGSFGNGCTVRLDDGTEHRLSAALWNSVIRSGLEACGFVKNQGIAAITVMPCEIGEAV